MCNFSTKSVSVSGTWLEGPQTEPLSPMPVFQSILETVGRTPVGAPHAHTRGKPCNCSSASLLPGGPHQPPGAPGRQHFCQVRVLQPALVGYAGLALDWVAMSPSPHPRVTCSQGPPGPGGGSSSAIPPARPPLTRRPCVCEHSSSRTPNRAAASSPA